MTLLPSPHPTHDWVVDVLTHRVIRRTCAECLVEDVDTSPALVLPALPIGLVL